MPRQKGPSVRLRLALSYAGFLLVAGFLLLSVVWVFLLRYVPDGEIFARQFVPNRSDLLRAFVPPATWAMVCLLVFGLAGGWFLAGRMLAPLARIGDAARLAAEGSLSHRIRLEGSDDEFRRLADVFDGMLERLEAHVAEQERFAANASHELRTPLAITQTMLDVAQKDPERDVDQLLARLRAVNTRAIELADALLLLSRTSRGPIGGGTVDLSLLAEEAAENLLPVAERRGVSLEVGGDGAPCHGSEALLLQLTTNLVHNAIVHNLATDGTVTVTTAATTREAVLRVENTGPPLDAAGIPALLEPFQRSRGRVRADGADHAGAGLGLAIAQNIVAAHRGQLTLVPRHGGGAVVTVRLPG
ncbi:MAG TPA: HAMP domain-containing sensor histidine kinase [Microbacterium sp.]|uniref:sensor histidine kinase n=1 Tax=Microbacterium sp. TaxID=51671 RepID=UPI002B45F538|nr:HAMP domain-containing sensor histidine kinase [Microbacterium sp.]HKT56413.1 HAMP domain-containing sensor histidine kinase [Microbacterium sp.]